MADKPLFNLDTDGRWRLAYDRQQWVIQRRTQKPRVRRLEGHAIADTGWRGVPLRRRQEGDAGPLISREGHIPDGRSASTIRRTARAIHGIHRGPGEVRRPMGGGGMSITVHDGDLSGAATPTPAARRQRRHHAHGANP